MLSELEDLEHQMNEIYIAVLQASTVVLPYRYYSEEQVRMAQIVRVGDES